MYKYIITPLFLLIIHFGFSQTGSISGTVRSSDGQPVPYVVLMLQPGFHGTTSNDQGQFEFRNLPVGVYLLKTEMLGLETQEQSLEVKANSVQEITLQLKESNAELQTVIISAEKEGYKKNTPSTTLRLKSSLLETPQNIQVITAKSLQDQQVISMSDGVLRNVSGAARVEHWGDLYTNVVSRGSQVMAFRNGFNVVNSAWGPLTEDMSFVDRIEFVKGPAGFMLSNGDPSGLYNVVTKKPTGREKGQISLTLGSFDLYRTALDLDGVLSKNGKLLYRLNLSAQNKKSHRDNEYNNRYVIAPVLAYRLDDKTKLTFEYNYQRANMSNVGSFYVFSTDGFATLDRNFTMLPAGMPGTTINDHSFYLTLQHDINDRWSLTAQAAKFKYLQNGSSMWPGVVESNGNIIRGVSSWDAKSDMNLAQAFLQGEEYTGPIRHRFLGGLDLGNKSYFADWGQYHALDTLGSYNVFNSNNGMPVNGFPEFDFTTPIEQRAQMIGGLIDQRYASAYIQDELALMDNHLRITLAGRYTYVNQSQYGGAATIADHITPRAGLSYSLSNTTSLYALYDQAFTPQTGRMADGSDVQPITGNNMEFGFKKEWFNGRWNSTVAVYRILKNNELTADPNSPPTSGLSVELGQKRAQGIELDIRGKIFNGLQLIANYAYTDSRVTKVTSGVEGIAENDIVPGYATHTANAWISYQFQSGLFNGFGLSSGISYLGDRHTYWAASPTGGSVLPDYFKWDGGVFWSKENIRITANAFNLLNDYLYSGSYYAWLNAYYWQSEPGRNIRLSIDYQF